MEKPKQIYVFIDSQNLNLGIKGCGWKLDFRRFFIYLKDKYKKRGSNLRTSLRCAPSS